MPAATMTTPATCGENQRIMEGYLNHVHEQRAAQRWVVLEKNVDQGILYLYIYRKEKETRQPETNLKKRYEISEANFVGTERGTIKDGGKQNVLYWAVILETETLLFKGKETVDGTRSNFENWNEVLKQHWKHQSWEVSPVKGEGLEEHPRLILHLNSTSLSLALMSPPRHYFRWPLSKLLHCTCLGCTFSFSVGGDNKPGFYEVKVTRSRHASKIKAVCTELLQAMNDKKKLLPQPSSATNLNHKRLEASPSTVELAENVDTMSIASFDSISSTPSPTPQKYERNSSPPNPFTFPHEFSCERGMSSPCIESHIQVQIPVSHHTFPLYSPRNRRTVTPSSPYHVSPVNPSAGACPGKASPSTQGSDGIDSSGHPFSSLDPHPHPSPLPTTKSPARDPVAIVTHLDEKDASHNRPSLCKSSMSSSYSLSSTSSSSSSTSSSSSSSSTSTITPPPSSPLSLPKPMQNQQKGQLLRPRSVPGGGSRSSSEDHRKHSFEDLRNSTTSCSSYSPAVRTHYMNVHDRSDRVDMSTKPDERPTYMNVGDKSSHYQNPVMGESSIDSVGPRVPPKPQPPQVPPRRRKLHEIVEKGKTGHLVVSRLIPSLRTLKQFCMVFDIKKELATPRDWRALAERIGMTINDINMVDFYAQEFCKATATEMVLAYWESNTPDHIPYTLDQLIKELDALDRQDLISIVKGAEH